jgi:hypothetical protein
MNLVPKILMPSLITLSFQQIRNGNGGSKPHASPRNSEDDKSIKDPKGLTENIHNLSVKTETQGQGMNDVFDKTFQGHKLLFNRVKEQAFSKEGISPGTVNDIKATGEAIGEMTLGTMSKVVAKGKPGAPSVVLDTVGDVLIADGLRKTVISGENTFNRITAINDKTGPKEDGVDIHSPLEDMGDVFGIVIITLSNIIMIVLKNCPEGKFDSILYFTLLIVILKSIHYIYSKCITWVFHQIRQRKKSIDEKKEPSKK